MRGRSPGHPNNICRPPKPRSPVSGPVRPGQKPASRYPLPRPAEPLLKAPEIHGSSLHILHQIQPSAERLARKLGKNVVMVRIRRRMAVLELHRVQTARSSALACIFRPGKTRAKKPAILTDPGDLDRMRRNRDKSVIFGALPRDSGPRDVRRGPCRDAGLGSEVRPCADHPDTCANDAAGQSPTTALPCDWHRKFRSGPSVSSAPRHRISPPALPCSD